MKLEITTNFNKKKFFIQIKGDTIEVQKTRGGVIRFFADGECVISEFIDNITDMKFLEI